jgi:hypothetical protein
MSNTICAINLKFPVLPFDIMPTVPAYMLKKFDWTILPIPKSTIKKEFVDFLHSLNLKIVDHNMIFATLPGGKSYLHVDSVDKKHNLAYINYVYGSDNHEMIWYDIDKFPKPAGNEIYTKFRQEYEMSAKKLWRHVVKYPTLVKIGIPHQVFNYDDKTRYCVSISIAPIDHDEHENTLASKAGGVDFDWAAKSLQEYIVP